MITSDFQLQLEHIKSLNIVSTQGGMMEGAGFDLMS